VRLQDEVAAIRTSAAMSSGAHVAAVRVSGQGAFDAVDRVCPRELYIQEGQALHTVLLDDEAHAVADVYVCAGAEDFLVLGETRAGASLMDYLSDRLGQAPNVALDDLSSTHRVVSLNGPYCWEILADVLTPEIIGLPYLGLFDAGDCTCLRAGKTGEYGYDLLVPRENAAQLEERIVERGAGFDLGVASLEALDACALENFFFNVRREGAADVTPIELQLQWRVSYQREYPGAAALLERRSRVAKRRAVLVAAETELATGDAVTWGERRIGELIAAAPSYTLGGSLGIALLDAPLAHAGLSDFAAARGELRVALRTLSAPPVDNRSLYVDPQRHSYRTREADVFPPVGVIA
jgi:aminomethyltransferase